MIHSHVVYALIDPGSTFLYITPFVTGKLDMRPKLLPQSVEVSMQVGDLIITSHIYRGSTMLINERPASTDLVELIMVNIDVIMAMDWLVDCYANIYCLTKLVHFYFLDKPIHV